jgi:uncharacterized protein YijF (DUF1287 family)
MKQPVNFNVSEIGVYTRCLFFCCITVFLFGFKQVQSFYERLAESALAQTKMKVVYTPDYVSMKYPGGDVPANTGVCTDLVIRAYRNVGIDLQKEVHEDMKKRFSAYPALWKLKAPDSNIDHRRVPNLMTFFKLHQAEIPLSKIPSDYQPGDLVTWNLQNRKSMAGITHIGIVTNQKSSDGLRYQIAHNIGAGNVVEDMLFDYVIIGHYRFEGR